MKKKLFGLCVIFGLCLGLLGCNNKKDNSELNSKELQSYLESEGFTFKIDDVTSKVTTHYVICYTDDIWIQQIDNPYLGPMSSFKNVKVNDDFADILDKEMNKTRPEKEQYDAYLDWLDKNGIEKTQIQDVLQYYDENN